MLPRKLHLDQVNRFHDLLVKLDKDIESETDEDIKFTLLLNYYNMTKIWIHLDNSIENIMQDLNALNID